MDGDRLAGRNGAIWQDFIAGASQHELARKYEVSQQRVSQIIREVRDDIPQETKEDAITRSIELLMRLQQRVVATAENTDDPKEMLSAVTTLVKMQERQAKLLGLDAAVKVEASVNEAAQAEASLAAAEAARRVAGD